MLCPMKFSVGCSSESKECEGKECAWFVYDRFVDYGTCAIPLMPYDLDEYENVNRKYIGRKNGNNDS